MNGTDAVVIAEKDQLVLLCVEYIISKHGIELDWNAVGKEIEPYLTGEAIKQHLSKLRVARDEAGQKNPPKLDRKAVNAARKKANPLLDTTSKAPKAPKTPKRRVKQESDDEDLPAKPAPKTTGLLHLKPEKNKSTPKKRKIKQESDDDMACESSKPSRESGGEELLPTPSKKAKKEKKGRLPPNFPPALPPPPPEEEARSPEPRPEPRSAGAAVLPVWSPAPWNLHATITGGGVGEDEDVVLGLRPRGGTVHFGGDGAGEVEVEGMMGAPPALPDLGEGDPNFGTLDWEGWGGGMGFGDEPLFFGDFLENGQ